jgi:hypothetical protein
MAVKTYKAVAIPRKKRVSHHLPPSAATLLNSDLPYRVAFSIDQLKTPNPLNGSHRHWRSKSAEVKLQRQAAWAAAVAALVPGNPQSDCIYRVSMTRISPRAVDKFSVWGCLKAVQDGIADALGFSNDDDARLQWSADQGKCKIGQDGVYVTIEILASPAVTGGAG